MSTVTAAPEHRFFSLSLSCSSALAGEGSSEYTAAQALCSAQGLNGTVLASCVFDLLASGDMGMAQSTVYQVWDIDADQASSC